MSDMTIARITIERYLTDEADDLVRVESSNMNGSHLHVVEALGLLQLAIYDVSNHEEPSDE